MPAPTTTDEFLELVRKSGVIDEKRLTTHLDKLRGAGSLPAEPIRLATQMVRDGVITHFQAEQFLQGKWKRFTLGKYKVLERLGQGGMGSVYLCEHMLMRRRVAVKVLPATKAEESSSLDRFYREARAVAALDHPNIVRAYDIDQDGELHFLVMEHVDGSSLQEIIKRAGPMDVIRAAHYIRQAALGLQHAHETAGLIHRDIKPGNILVDRNGIVKILDMGLARFFHDEDDQLTKKHDESVLGTADYLAPEQALDSHGVDIRADVYSLGATFYYCLTGRTPFAEGSVAQKLIWHQTRAPKPIRSFRPEVPEGIIAVIERMMAKDPNQRFQTPQEVADALIPWTQTPIPPPPESEMPQFSLAAAKPELGVPSSTSRPASDASPSPSKKVWQVSGSAAMQATAPISAANTRSAGPVTPSRQASAPPAPAAEKSPAPPPVKPTAPAPAPAPAARAPAPAAPTSSPGKASPSSPAATNNGALRSPRPAARKPAPAPAAPEPEPPEPVAPPHAEEIQEEPDEAPFFTDDDSGPPSIRALRRKPAAAREKSHLVLWISLGSGIGLALLVALFLIFRPSDPSSTGNVKREAIHVGGSNPGTIAQALKKVGRNAHIILDGDINEANVWVRANHSGLTIEAAPDKTIVWKCPPDAGGNSKLLFIESATNVTIKGINFDGADKTVALIGLFGNCTGTLLERLQLRNSAGDGVLFSNCMGDGKHPVILRGIEFLTKPTMTAVHFTNLPNQQIHQNSYIRLEGCRFDGPGKQLTKDKDSDIDDVTVKVNPVVPITKKP